MTTEDDESSERELTEPAKKLVDLIVKIMVNKTLRDLDALRDEEQPEPTVKLRKAKRIQKKEG